MENHRFAGAFYTENDTFNNMYIQLIKKQQKNTNKMMALMLFDVHTEVRKLQKEIREVGADLQETRWHHADEIKKMKNQIQTLTDYKNKAESFVKELNSYN